MKTLLPTTTDGNRFNSVKRYSLLSETKGGFVGHNLTAEQMNKLKTEIGGQFIEVEVQDTTPTDLEFYKRMLAISAN